MKRTFDGERFAALVTEMQHRCDPPSLNELAHETRVSAPTLSRILANHRVPDPQTVEKLARRYPDLVLALYAAAGYDVPVGMVPIVAQVAQETGRPPMELVDEAMRALFNH